MLDAIRRFGLRALAAAAAICLAAPVLAAAESTPPADNLLPNGSFETGQAQSVQGWDQRAWGGGEQARWTVESPGRTGRRCLSIQSVKGADAAWWTTVAVKPNTFYRLSGWVRTRDVRGAVGALLNIQNMQTVRTPALSGTADWRRVSTVFRTDEQTRLEINCLFGGWGRSTGQAWFDDVSLEPVAQAAGALAAVTIDPQAQTVPYSPMIFGGFIEHFGRQVYGGLFEPGSPLSDANGFRSDVVAAMKELKLSIVRWPGGCFASGYQWQDGVGRQRKSVPDPVWGVSDPNTFGTDEFVRWCRLVGCEPYICTNAGSAPPEDAARWVEYCNAARGRGADLRRAAGTDEPLRVRYWSIGNENWGGHEIGAKTPDQWGPLVARTAELMRAADPSLKLMAAATANRNWTLPLLQAAGKHLDYVAVHEYWLPNWATNHTPDYLSCIVHSDGPERTINAVIAILDEAGVRGRVKIAFDEWNLRGWHHPGFPRKKPVDPADADAARLIAAREKNLIASQYTMADALFSASFLNACLRHAGDVGMANIAPIVNTRGPLEVHPRGIVRRTTFHTLAMYANLLQPRVAPAEVASSPLTAGRQGVALVDALATVNESRTAWSLVLINRHPTQAVPCAVSLGTRPLDGPHQATVLAGDSCDAFNDRDHPDRVTPEKKTLTFRKGIVDLPAHSLTIVNVQTPAVSCRSVRADQLPYSF